MKIYYYMNEFNFKILYRIGFKPLIAAQYLNHKYDNSRGRTKVSYFVKGKPVYENNKDIKRDYNKFSEFNYIIFLNNRRLILGDMDRLRYICIVRVISRNVHKNHDRIVFSKMLQYWTDRY